MIKREELLQLVKQGWKEDSPTLSIYFDTQDPRAFQCKSETMFRSMMMTIEKDLDPGKRSIFKQDQERAWDFLASYEPRAKSFVLFTDDSEAFTWAKELKVPLPTQARWKTRPFVRPLVEASDEYERYGVILIDKHRARLFTFFLGEIEEEEGLLATNEVRHLKTTGRDNLRSQMQLQRTDEMHVEWHCRHAVEAMESMARKHSFDRLILSGPKEAVDEFIHLLPAALRSRIVGRLHLPVDTPSRELMEAISELEKKVEREKEMELVELLTKVPLVTAYRTLGIEATLHELEKGQVHKLVYSERFHLNGGRCPGCKVLFDPTREMCGTCRLAIEPVEDLIEEMIWRLLPKGGRIEQVRGEAARRLNEVGGIGAILKR